MENQNSGKKLLVIIVVVILIAIILTIWLSLKQPSGSGVNTSEQLNFNAAQNANQSAILEIPDQFPGTIVYVSRVELPAGGWVVIREVVGDAIGEIIGSVFFDKDTRIGNVELTKPLVDGQTYLAQAFTDNGDAQFDPAVDKIITKADGTILEVTFHATKNLPERKD